jgi:hypothetical protein
MDDFFEFDPPEYISVIRTFADFFSDTITFKKLKIDKEFDIVCKKKFKVELTELKGGIKIPVKNRKELRGIDPGSKIYNEFFSTCGHSIEKVYEITFTAGYLSHIGFNEKYLEQCKGTLTKYGMAPKSFIENNIAKLELKKIYGKAYITFLEDTYRDGELYNYLKLSGDLDKWLKELQERYDKADLTLSRYEDENNTIENYLKSQKNNN